MLQAGMDPINLGNGLICLQTDADATAWPDMAAWCVAVGKVVAEGVPAYAKARPWEVAVRVASDDTVQGLNKEFRGKDKPTNVLSFPNDDDELEDRWYVGDVVLAAPTVEAEAVAQGKRLEHHVCHLVLHGLLHLVGYDHIKPAEAAVMETLETKLLQILHIENPYMETV